MNPFVSVIIPVYNAEEFLKSCLDSVTSQSLQEIEVICVDDGSVDSSPEMIKAYQQKDPRIVLLRQKNQGAGAARNAGIKAASGKYIAFMDSDDYYPDAQVLEDLYQAAETHHVSISGGSLWVDRDTFIQTSFEGITANTVFKQEGLFSYRDFQYDYGYYRFIYDRQMLVEHGVFFPDYRRFQDPPFFVKAMITAERFYALPRCSYIYRSFFQVINWNAERLSGLLSGLVDNITMARDHGLTKLASYTVKRSLVHREIITESICRGDEGALEKLQTFYQIANEVGYDPALIDGNLDDAYGAILDISKNQEMESQNAGIDAGAAPESGQNETLESNINAKEGIPGKAIIDVNCTANDVENEGDGDKIDCSVIIYNINDVEKFKKTLLSVKGQLLKNIEILCILREADQGAENTEAAVRDLLQEFVTGRVQILKCSNPSLGSALNQAIQKARGKYISFVRAKNEIASQMLATLFGIAETFRVDIVKSNYLVPTEHGREKIVSEHAGLPNCTVISPFENPRIFHWKGMLGTGLYKREFLEAHEIRFPEEDSCGEGAVSFLWKIWCNTDHVLLLKDAFYHCRMDAAEEQDPSLPHGPDCSMEQITGEMRDVASYLELHPELLEKYGNIFRAARAEAYYNYYQELFGTDRLDFLYEIRKDFAEDRAASMKAEDYHNRHHEQMVREVLELPEAYYYQFPGAKDPQHHTGDPSQEAARSVKAIKGDVKAASCSAEAPRLSIIVKLDENCLDSSLESLHRLQKQTEKNVEILCVASAAECDFPGASVFENWQQAVQVAKGDYVLPLDGADFLARTAVEELLHFIGDKEVDLVLFNGRYAYGRHTVSKAGAFLDLPSIPKEDIFETQEQPDLAGLICTDHAVWNRVYRKGFLQEFLQNNPSIQPGKEADHFVFSVLTMLKARTAVLNRDLLLHQRAHAEISQAEADRYLKALESCQDAVKRSYPPEEVQVRFSNFCLYEIEKIFQACRYYTDQIAFLQGLQESSLDLESVLSMEDVKCASLKRRNTLKSRFAGLAWNHAAKERKHCMEYQILTPYRGAAHPKVSVIVPVYNAQKYLRACMNCLQNQTLQDLEIICVNDGSTDNSLYFLQDYAARDPRICVVDQINGGQSSARNRGLELAGGEYIYYLDSDDYLDSDALRQLVADMEKRDLELLFFEGNVFYETLGMAHRKAMAEDNYIKYNCYPDIYTGPAYLYAVKENREYRVQPCMQLAKRSFLEENRIRFYEGIIYEDNLYTFQVLLKAQRVGHLHQAFYHRRLHGESTTMQQIHFRHGYGFFKCYQEMMQDLQHADLPDELKAPFYDEAINGCLNSAVLRYRQSGAEKEFFQTLPMEDYYAFESIAQARAVKTDALVREKEKAKETAAKFATQKEALETRAKTAEQKLKTANTKLKKAEQKQKATDVELKKLKASQKKLKKDLKSVKSSVSYKIGRKITAPGRKGKSFLKKVKGKVSSGKVDPGRKIGMYYYDFPNFGDQLDVALMKALGVDAQFCEFDTADIVMVGSILDRLASKGVAGKHIKKVRETARKDKPIHIWGAALMYDYKGEKQEFIRPVVIHALRGDKTRREIEGFMGKPVDCVLADPGLLAPMIVPKADFVWDVGIVPHFHDKEDPVFARLHEAYPNSVIIDVQQDPEVVLKQISQCRKICSTSLHGIIVADAYNIPNCWCECSDKIPGNGYKYHDYFSSFGTDREVFDLRGGAIPDLERDYVLSFHDFKEVRKKQKELLKSFPYKIRKS